VGHWRLERVTRLLRVVGLALGGKALWVQLKQGKKGIHGRGRSGSNSNRRLFTYGRGIDQINKYTEDKGTQISSCQFSTEEKN
jgi:hypothetical protein